MKSGHHPGTDMLYTFDNFIGGNWYTKQENLTVYVSCFVDDVKRVCTRMMAILHIETFVTFDFDPFLSLRLITVSNLDQIK